MEIMGSFPEREGKYLICPIHSSTKKNYPLYKILEEPKKGDIVFHYVLNKASKRESAITSYSIVRHGCYVANDPDPLCISSPPFRKIDLLNNTPLAIPITYEMLLSHKEELQTIMELENISRLPFDKNFRLKQLYIARIPHGFSEIFKKLSETNISI
tara:strand:+ start:148 stop:618 length:471 start_codon:yes stop_codon:yes gene_type:complete